MNKETSKEKLERLLKKRIQTTMIGALDSIEKKFGFLWGQDSEGQLSEKQEKLQELYEELRSEILDKGNNQIRCFHVDLENFDVTWLRYHLNLPIRRDNGN